MPTPPRLPLLLLLLLWGAGGASAQFDRDWINFVLPRFKQYQKERYENTIFKNVRREWPGGGSVHHIVPLNALMKCVALISSLGTNDLDQVVAAMQAFVNAMPELSNAATRSVMQKHYDDYIYRLELMLEAVQWNPGNTLTGPPSVCRVSDPGEAYEADIVAIMRDGNATEALKARQLEDFLKVTDRCTPSKAVKSGAGTTNPTALASVLAFFRCQVELIDTEGITAIPLLPYPDNLMGWSCSADFPGKMQPCRLSDPLCTIIPVPAVPGAGGAGASGAGAGGAGGAGAGGAGGAGASGAGGAGAGGAGGEGAGSAASSAAGSSDDGSSSSNGAGEGGIAPPVCDETTGLVQACIAPAAGGAGSAGEGAGGAASSAAGPSGSAEGSAGDGGSAASSTEGAGGSGGAGD